MTMLLLLLRLARREEDAKEGELSLLVVDMLSPAGPSFDDRRM